jgi:hypothetical protein
MPARCLGLFDSADRKLVRFLNSGGYPDDSDLVNAHHALKIACPTGSSSTDEIFAVSPLPKNRMKVCLALLENKGVICRENRNHFRLVKEDMSREQLAILGESYRLRKEREIIHLQQVAEYSETLSCRWDYLLRYFDDSQTESFRCGNCDRCRSAV